jgi:anaerobic ribonucleoside-triphosphate reductase activating protein
MAQLLAGGLVPLTTTDYPGCLAAVVFCQGCPWQCRYCHNPHLIPRENPEAFTWSQAMAFLARRQGLLDAVVFSGGEPTLQSGLTEAMADAKAMGFRVGLHTAGVYPDRLEKVIPWLDWVGLDVKAPFADYGKITGAGGGEAVRQSIRLLLKSSIPVEFRTTCHSRLLLESDLLNLAAELAELGATSWILQAFRPQGCKDALAEEKSEPPSQALMIQLSKRIGAVEYRAA